MTSVFRLAVDVRMIRSSGIGTYCRNILSRLIRDQVNWHFSLLGNPSAIAEVLNLNPNNVEVIEFTPPIYGFAEQASWLLKKLRVDLLWVPHYNIPLLWRHPLAVTVHDLNHLALTVGPANRVKRLYPATLMHHIRSHAACIIFVSDFTRSEFQRLVGQPEGRSWVIKEGVDPLWFSARSALCPDPPYVIYLGNIKPHKNCPASFSLPRDPDARSS